MPSRKTDRPRILLLNRCVVFKDDKILLVQRSKNDSFQPGKWELPGGKLDIGQEPNEALEREVLEETGLYVKLTSPKFFVDTKMLASGSYAGMACVLIVGEAKVIGGKLKLSEEHDDYKWVTIEEAFDIDVRDTTRKTLALYFEKLELS